MKRVIYIVFLISLLTPLSCISEGKECIDSVDNSNGFKEKSEEPNTNHISNDAPLDWVKDVPEKLDMDDYRLIIETYLWRDFMPITPPEGKPLKAVIKVIAEGIKEIPGSIKVKYIWVIKNEDEIWETESLKEQPPEYPNEKKVFVDNGPVWEPGLKVDVVIKITDARTGDAFLLKASKQVIQRTD